MEINRDTNAFINDYVKELKEGNASLFVGAGLSRAAGFVDWKGLLSDITHSLGLDIDKENDLLSIAQYHVNKHGRARINKKILDEFTEETEETENHQIIARLPLRTIWTTNYDTLIENACKKYNKTVDVKYSIEQLFNNKPKRDLILYKMHGDIELPDKAILTKEDYEGYYYSHDSFITALGGELISKTFLFLGFSFSDPNIDQVLSRLNYRYKTKNREHYYLLKRCDLGDCNNNQADLDYSLRKQQLFISELKRFGITTILIDKYPDITQILREIENRFRKSSIFISGSAVEYGDIGCENATKFIHLLSREIIKKDLRVVNGFGLGVGSAVINGALDAIYSNPKRYSEEQLVLKPFPQFKTGTKELSELWNEYRERMISMSGIAIFLLGNKKNEHGETVNSDGIYKEFALAKRLNVIPIPLNYTGYMTSEIYNEVEKNIDDYYEDKIIFEKIKNLKFNSTDIEGSVKSIIEIIQQLNK